MKKKEEITLVEMINMVLNQVEVEVSEDLLLLNPEYGQSFAEVNLNGVDYQVQLNITPFKKDFIHEDKLRVRFDEDNLPTLDKIINK